MTDDRVLNPEEALKFFQEKFKGLKVPDGWTPQLWIGECPNPVCKGPVIMLNLSRSVSSGMLAIVYHSNTDGLFHDPDGRWEVFEKNNWPTVVSDIARYEALPTRVLVNMGGSGFAAMTIQELMDLIFGGNSTIH